MPREGRIPLGSAKLYFREIGRGRPILVLHGGPDFDHRYFVPEMDRLSDAYRLLYYDQRGRGRSAAGVEPSDVTLASEIEDLEGVRKYFGLESTAVLGHSWGGVLALEYGLRHPERVSHLILMNTAPASHDDYLLLQEARRRSAPDDVEKLRILAAGVEYRECDPETVVAYYRVHFRAALRRPEHLERVIERLRASFTREGIRKARTIEDRLMDETWRSSHYDVLPQLERLEIPTLVLHGNHDLIPVECAAHVAQAVPGARFVVVGECGHFAFLEAPDRVRKEIDTFFRSSETQ